MRYRFVAYIAALIVLAVLVGWSETRMVDLPCERCGGDRMRIPI